MRAWGFPEYIDLNGEELAFIQMKAKLMALSGDGTQMALMTPNALEMWGVPALATSDGYAYPAVRCQSRIKKRGCWPAGGFD